MDHNVLIFSLKVKNLDLMAKADLITLIDNVKNAVLITNKITVESCSILVL